MKRVWPLTEKIEENQSFNMEEQARIALAAYCERFGRVRTLELLDELRQEVLAMPLRPLSLGRRLLTRLRGALLNERRHYF
jgi:hypothetical protein